MSAETDALSLPEALREARRVYGVTPSYQALWTAVAEGRIAAEQRARRYSIPRAALPEVAALARPRRIPTVA